MVNIFSFKYKLEYLARFGHHKIYTVACDLFNLQNKYYKFIKLVVVHLVRIFLLYEFMMGEGDEKAEKVVWQRCIYQRGRHSIWH